MKADLVYDVGLHKGEDTDYYLKKGFRVVAIEANSELVNQCKVRFSNALASGQLQIVEGAIASSLSGSSVTFYKNDAATILGTIDSDWAKRNAQGGYYSKEVKVNRVEMAEVFRNFGIPFYLKIDAKGADAFVLDSLRYFSDRPKYISIESEKVDFAQLKHELNTLQASGYSKFKVVQQRSIPGTKILTKTLDDGTFEHTFEDCSSGPFGDDIPQPWLTIDAAEKVYEQIFFTYRYFGDRSTYTRLPRVARGVISTAYKLFTGHRGPLPGWYDTHASL
jgi:FkbM family methyltransferase